MPGPCACILPKVALNELATLHMDVCMKANMYVVCLKSMDIKLYS